MVLSFSFLLIALSSLSLCREIEEAEEAGKRTEGMGLGQKL
jgi:hypothetical protein